MSSNKPSEPNSGSGGNSPFANRNTQRIWLAIGIVVLLVFLVIFAQPNNTQRGAPIPLDRLAERIKDGDVTEMIVRGGNDVTITLNSGAMAYYYKERETDLFNALEKYGVTSEELANVNFSERPGDATPALLMNLALSLIHI